MQPAFFVLFSMMTTGIALAVILGIAWAGFARPRHALSWAAAYGISALLWGGNLVVALGWPEAVPSRAFAVTLGALVSALLAVGFRQRAGLRVHRRWSGAGLAGFILVAAYAGVSHPGSAADRALLPLFIALTEIVSAATLVGRDWRSNLGERAMFVALLVFAAFNLALAMVGLFDVDAAGGRSSDVDIRAYRVITLLGTPTIFTTTGLFCVFLLAVDLAEKMRRLAILDPLTNVLNRRGLEQAAEQAIANARRAGAPASIVLADLDRFKQINDTRGHAAGDRALARFAAYVEHAIRRGDLFGRIGGEEFALLLANADAATALEVSERIRAGLADLDIGMDGHRLTCSFGVAELAPADAGFADAALRADAALYASKLAGRDRVTLADRPPEGASAPVSTGARRQSQPRPARLR